MQYLAPTGSGSYCSHQRARPPQSDQPGTAMTGHYIRRAPHRQIRPYHGLRSSSCVIRVDLRALAAGVVYPLARAADIALRER
jgi:hypothetical protein